MATHFAQTLVALSNDGPRRTHLVWVMAAIGVAAWMVWFATAPVTLYGSSVSARIEAQGSAHEIDVPVAGAMMSLRATLGMFVKAGDTIAELDDTEDRLRLAEAGVALSALQAKADHLVRQIAAREASRQDELASAQAATAVAQTHNDEVIVALDFARGRSERLAKLGSAGGATAADVLKAKAETDTLAATQSGWVSEILRIQLQAHARDAQTMAEIEGLDNDRAATAGDIETARTTLELVRRATARHRVRASVAGRIGDLTSKQPGAYLAAGERLVTIVPDGPVVIVAEFSAADALGKVRVGQTANFRLDTTASAPFGAIAATVSAVSAETRDNLLRVELAIDPNSPGAAALQHGQPGSVDIAIDTATPAGLVFRAAGIGGPSPARREAAP